MDCRTASKVAAPWLSVALALSIAGGARADEPSASDKNLAQSLFDEARRLMDQQRYGDACPRFEESERLEPGGGTVLNLALCYDKLGKLALAYRTYNDAISLAIAEHRREREKFARDRAAAIAPRLSHLTLHVSDAPGIEIKLDGAAVPAAAWATAMVVDPGGHTVDSAAPGYAPWQALLTLKEGEARDLDVAPVLEPVPAPEAPSPEGLILPPPPPPAPAARVIHVRSTTFYAFLGTGLASFAVSAVTGGMAWVAHESAAQKCGATGFCADPSGIDDASRARALAWASTVTLGTGVLATIVACALPATSRVVVGGGPGGAFVALRVAWR
jgi:hypothetical protein